MYGFDVQDLDYVAWPFFRLQPEVIETGRVVCLHECESGTCERVVENLGKSKLEARHIGTDESVVVWQLYGLVYILLRDDHAIRSYFA